MERRDFMTGQLLDPQPKLTRLVSPKAKEMIAKLRDGHNPHWPIQRYVQEICDILDELNEQEVRRG